ncbi:MAG: cation:proton antiporter [Cyanobacteria bacterium RI_101]|nr:cation:proton antiporter [Cyanobacteria bacterium RI_101]
MRWIYLLASLGFTLKMLTLTPTAPLDQDWSNIAALVAEQGGVPNAVAGIIFRNRLYDTIFEVIVFTIAIAGVKHLLADEKPQKQIHLFPDRASAIMARLGATITTLVAVELAIRGHLSPGGGFAAGVAGGTAIGLIAMTSAPAKMEEIYRRWHTAAWEKISVLAFLALAVLALTGITPPMGEMGALLSGGFIPWFNLLVAIKVALGSWAAVLLFIRYRGLL